MSMKRPRVLRIARLRLRRLARRLDRESPPWLRELTPWGTSLALHALLLLLLALVVRYGDWPARKAVALDADLVVGQLRDDIISLKPGDRAGDPFTKLQTEESPSISLTPALDSSLVHASAMPKEFEIGPELLLKPVDSTGGGLDRLKSARGAGPPAGKGGLEGPALDLGASVPFTGRQGEAKARLLRREGGTKESEAAVELGLDWLARHQRPDGGWSLDVRAQCQDEGCPGEPAAHSDVAATGLALLPLLGAGHSHVHKDRYQQTIQRGLNWLIKVQSPTGELDTGCTEHAKMYTQAIATMALCEAYALTHDKRLRDPAQKAVNYVVRTQTMANGGWRYQPGSDGDTSVFGWMIFALRSARLGGLDVPKGTLRRCKLWLDLASADRSKAMYVYQPGWPVTASMTAEALVSRQLLGWSRDFPALVKGASFIAEHLEQNDRRSIYYWYYATQLLHNMGGKPWTRWNVRVREALIGMQAKGKGCDRGSWSPYEPEIDSWGQKGGRLYETSLSLLTLEVYYRYLPLYQDRGGQISPEEFLGELAADKPAADEAKDAAKDEPAKPDAGGR